VSFSRKAKLMQREGEPRHAQRSRGGWTSIVSVRGNRHTLGGRKGKSVKQRECHRGVARGGGR